MDRLRGRWMDISVPLYEGMAQWPDDPGFRIRRVKDMGAGESHNVSEITMGSHMGTHVDPPKHFLAHGEGVDAMPAEVMVSRAQVIEIADPKAVTASELKQHSIEEGVSVLFKTRNSPSLWESGRFSDDYVALALDAAELLVARHVVAVGIDYLSIGGMEDGEKIHRTLLRGGVWVIEGLNLTGVGAGFYDLICLPIKIKGGDGAPARALLRAV